jgi:zinc transporter ZupT
MDILLMFVVATAGGCLPLLVRWSDRTLHAALAFSTGIFMGAVFLHLLPSLPVRSADAHEEHAATPVESVSPPAPDAAAHLADGESFDMHLHGDTTLWMFVLLGVLGVYLIEALFFRTDHHDDLHRHRAVGYATFTGLCIHALTEGVAYSMTRGHEEVAGALFIAIIAHKGFETFSLTSVFQLAEFSRGKVLSLTLLFAAVTPLGVVVGGGIQSGLGEMGFGILTALAAGTFLYVCLCELLSEVFHHREDGPIKILLLGAGVGLMMLTHGAL